MFGPQKRWCAIKDGIFYYYVSETAKKQKGAFYLSGVHEKRKTADQPREKQSSLVCAEQFRGSVLVFKC